MHDVRYAVVACVLLFGALAGRPSCAAVVGPPPEAQVRAAEVDWTHAQHYDIILSEFHFAPSRIVLQHGEPYALRLENRGRFRHTFTAPEFFRAVAFRPGEPRLKPSNPPAASASLPARLRRSTSYRCRRAPML